MEPDVFRLCGTVLVPQVALLKALPSTRAPQQQQQTAL